MRKSNLLILFGLLLIASIVIGATITTTSEADFKQGTYNNVTYNYTYGFLGLNYTDWVTNNSYVLNGTYLSKIYDLVNYTNVSSIRWVQNAPYQVELQSNRTDESQTTYNGLNMANNVLLFHFNNDSSRGENNTFAYDDSGNGFKLYSYGVQYNLTTNGKFNGGLRFIEGDNIGQYELNQTTFNNNFNATIKNQVTISLWLKDIVPRNSYSYVIEMAQALTGTETLKFTQTEITLVNTTGGSNGFNVGSDLNYNLSDGYWHNFVITYNGTEQAVWEDGLKLANKSLRGNLYSGTNNKMHLWLNGRDASANGNGTIDELAIWNRTLSNSEITGLYKRGALYLNVSGRSCDNSDCSDRGFSQSTSNPNTTINLSPGRYFQYRAELLTINSNFTPQLHNLSFDYQSSSRLSYQLFNFSNPVSETSYQNYNASLVFYSPVTVSSIYFVYNNSLYLDTNYVSNGSNLFIYMNNFSVPTVAQSSNNTFLWEINTLEFGQVNTSSNVQEVDKLQPLTVSRNCTVNKIFEFNFLSEPNLTSLIPDEVDYNFRYGLEGNTSSYSIYGAITNFTNPAVVDLCLNSTTSYYTIGYGELDYKKTGYTTRTFYVFSNTRSSSTQINTTLYFLDNSLATTFQVTAQQTSLNPYAGYYLQLLRWYPQNNTYNVVEMAKTDDLGNGVLRVKTEDVQYRIGLYDVYGTLIRLTNPVTMLCQTTPCSYTIGVDLSSSNYINSELIQQSLEYTNSTGAWVYTWSDPSQTTRTMNLTVWKDTGLLTYPLCSAIGSGSVGVISCSTQNITGTMRAEVYRSASPPVLILQKLVDTDTTAFTSSLGLFFSLLLGIPIILMFGFASPYVAILGGIIALLPALMMRTINPTIFGGFIIIGIIILQVLRQDN